MKPFPYKTRHLEHFKDIRNVENEQEIKELCPAKIGSFFYGLGFLNPYSTFQL